MIYPFEYPHAGDPTPIVGGKGASLATMVAMGLPVPPGFTLPIGGDWSMAEVRAGLDAVGHAVGRRFSDPDRPLLVSVRSGAAVSMPGMMDTVLNVGLTRDTIDGLSSLTGDTAFARDSYDRFVQQFTETVGDPGDDAFALLERTIRAVYASWDSPRARHYRQAQGLDEAGGTAVTIQAMVFGNLDAASGTGVVFSRDPATGAPGATGDYLVRAQGEAVVAGEAATVPYAELENAHPGIYAQMAGYLDILEAHYGDMVDVEFTIESGRLWILQARRGKRTPAAAARIAVDLVEVGTLTPADALARIPEEYFTHDVRTSSANGALTQGLGASPGLATGAVVLDPMEAVERGEAGPVILVRNETSPADIHGMSAATGILTTLGGRMSHAAVVARSWSLPAVVGAADVKIGEGRITIGETVLAEGDTITVDGTSGAVFAGERPGERVADPVREIIDQWRAERGGTRDET